MGFIDPCCFNTGAWIASSRTERSTRLSLRVAAGLKRDNLYFGADFLALPRDASTVCKNNGLVYCLGAGGVIENKGFSATSPKLFEGLSGSRSRVATVKPKSVDLSQKENAVPAGPRNGAKHIEKADAFDANPCLSASRLSIASELRQLARALRRGPGPLRADPEAILLAKDEIAGRLCQLAKRMEAANV